MSVRSGESPSGSVRDLFHRHSGLTSERIFLLTEMIILSEGIDSLGQKAEASITTLRYRVEIAFVEPEEQIDSSGLRLISEDLIPLPKSESGRHIQFPHNASRWRHNVVTGKGRRGAYFISTNKKEQKVALHQEGNSGRPKRHLIAGLPRTVLSNVNATESPTALLAKREMESWRLLQLEPSALRLPDNLLTRPGLLASGAHLPATLYSLASRKGRDQSPVEVEQVAGRLSELLDDIKTVAIHRDEVRQLFILQLTSRNGTTFSARSLSDGTLRFLALATLAEDPSALGVICMEEPDSGIQPARIPAILDLLKDIACDPNDDASDDNPLRQVIINTHLPTVVQLINEADLLVAVAEQQISEGKRFTATVFRWLPGTWRDKTSESPCPTVPKGLLLSYLGPIAPSANSAHSSRPAAGRRVRDRPELRGLARQLALGLDAAEP